MKYLKRYNKFLDKNIKDIDKHLRIVEKEVLGDFSDSFWEMSLNSSSFSIQEKLFIRDNLVNRKVDLVQESWLKDALTFGGKVWDGIKNKVNLIRKNIKDICLGISKFIQSLLKSFSDSITTKSENLKKVVTKDFTEKVKLMLNSKKPNPEDVKTELGQLQVTYDHLKSAAKVGFFVATVDKVDDSVIKDAESQVNNLESELKKESSNYDILSAFLITEADTYKVGDVVKFKSKEGDEIEKKIIKIEGDSLFFKTKDGKEYSKNIGDILGKVNKAWSGFTSWFLDMEKSTPPQKGKVVWWIKFIVKVVALLLSPVVKALEVSAKFISSNVLKGASIASKYLNGPGPFDFLILGGILAGIPALAAEFSLLTHKMPDPYAHIFEIVSNFLTELSGVKSILLVLGAFCTAMTLTQLCIEFKHLFASHTENTGSENKPQIKPS
jgi:hypothetical protein